jgi:O-antigen/teichoic acid export membrane protein
MVTGVATYAFFAIASRQLDASAYASLGVLWALLFTVGNGMMQPLEQEVARAVSDRRAKGLGAGPVIRRATTLGLGFTAVLAAGAVAFHSWLTEHLFSGDEALLGALLLGLLGFCIGHLVRGALSSHGRFKAYGVFFGVDGLVRPIGAAALAVAGIVAVGTWGVLVAFAPFVATGVALWGQRGLVDPGPEAPWAELTRALGWLLVGTGSTALLINGGVLAVELLATPAQEAAAGVFLSGLLIARIPLFLFQAVLASLLPKLSHLVGRRQFDEFSLALRRLVLAVAVVGAIATVVAIAIGPFVVELFFGSEATLTSRDLGLLTAAAVILMVGVALGQAVIALGGHWRFALGWLLAVLVFVGVIAVGDDLFLRVEVAMLLSSIAATMWMSVFVVNGVHRHAVGDEEVDLAEAIAEVPLQP